MSTTTVAKVAKGKPDQLIVGTSSAISDLKAMITRIAPSSASVMISGPSGSGKEMVARTIHDQSDRADKPFIAINCGAIPADLIESELFGHERGSFTGAHSRRIGRFEEANGGTLFLDEIGDMRFDMQVKLLRVLEDGIVSRVGGASPIPVDVRIISATHQNIEEAIDDRRFREDLYFRLGVVLLRVPDLASRTSDIPDLIRHFKARSVHCANAKFDQSGLKRLMDHQWPGNVRELRNIVERAGIIFPGQALNALDVEKLLGRTKDQSVGLVRSAEVTPTTHNPNDREIVEPIKQAVSMNMPVDLRALLETMELERIQMALDTADGVISEAAKLLMLKRTTLIEKMRKYGVGKLA